MGLFTEKITLKNYGDVYATEHGYTKEEAIRQVTIDAIVDSGASSMVIPEAVCNQLGLRLRNQTEVTAVGGKLKTQYAEPVEVHWQDRLSVCMPLVLSGEAPALLGALPMEEMDLMIHPKERRLVGAHGSQTLFYA